MRAVFSLPCISSRSSRDRKPRCWGEDSIQEKGCRKKDGQKGEENYGKTFIYFRICNRGTSGQNV